MENEPDIAKLLRLKRYEQPPPGYYDDFLNEFQRRQRMQAIERPSLEVLWERLMSLAPSFRVPQFAYAAIIAVAASVSTLIVTKQPGTAGQSSLATVDSTPSTLSSPAIPVTIGQTLPAAVSTDGSSLPPHYVLQPRPVSNERPLSF